MPIASPEVYAEMIDRAKSQGFAYPAINCTSSQTINAAIRGFAEAGSDGIIQLSTGGAEYISGPTIKDRVRGAIAFSAFATCPAPVPGNVVPFAVTAGERRPPFFYSEAGINVPFLFYVWWDEESAEVTRPWYSRFGLDITILNPNHDDGRLSLVSFDGVAMSGGDLSPLGRKARSRLIDVATEALTSRIPVIGIGAYSAFVIQAQRELRSQQGYADGIEREYEAPADRLLIVMNNELNPKKAGFDIVHTDASGLIYVEMPFDIPLESDRTEVEDFQAAMESDAPITSWQEFDYRMVALIRHHR